MQWHRDNLAGRLWLVYVQRVMQSTLIVSQLSLEQVLNASLESPAFLLAPVVSHDFISYLLLINEIAFLQGPHKQSHTASQPLDWCIIKTLVPAPKYSTG